MKWWIDHPRLLGSHNPSQRELDVEDLLLVVSLIDRGEESLRYYPDNSRFRWMEIPVRDYAAPSPEQLLEFIAVVRETSGTVLVHCQGGCGRTGTFGAAWLMHSKGLSAEEAIEAVRSVNSSAVETDSQVAVLHEFEMMQK